EVCVLVRVVVGVLLTLAAFAVAGRRLRHLYRLGRSGQPVADRPADPRLAVEAEATEVFGQRKLLKWSVPGLAHFFTFWGFVILASVYLEAYGALFDEKFAIPWIGHWAVLGFLQDFIAVAVAVSLGVFAVLRIRT